jgi:hypothetical protein
MLNTWEGAEQFLANSLRRNSPTREKPKQAIELARLLGWMESGVPNAHRRRHKWMLLLRQRLEAKFRHDQAEGVASHAATRLR